MDIDPKVLIGAFLAAWPLFFAPFWTSYWWGALLAAPLQLLGVWMLGGHGIPGTPIMQPGVLLYAGVLAWLAQIAGGPLPLQAKVRFILRVVAVVAVAVTGFVVSDGQWLVPLLLQCSLALGRVALAGQRASSMCLALACCC